MQAKLPAPTLLRGGAAASFRNELRSMIGPGGEDGLRSDFAK
ncbi:hypothetical protein BURPS406E_P0051 [Burkholderia pseudomallei 406e]|uniref:Uncharacterized protein n=1 Tax=Burkholderia pseudomallei (strain 1106a) TaxID=357348 RepID=A3P2C8_BURP0|nr:hypothetical protein BURPS1106A_A0445 [Burkholderia pseudomallei 1106a]ABO03053.1 hypothetical protein BMA10247_A0855 [Burkholderia mallei NCTC 10247]EBA44536.1 hypothetical protein BURPS305_0175 [Burkholderia pseudomallei 305]EDK86128.1 hypothetical protein BMA721280_I0711 [Burkholderia mallei 2002721280]EDO86850.1 hypothetical protein BURPS406E_P0051 [Burkholderia pseudomallei 406e]EDO92721.1 hypothetical protein BURPSPAST_E0041 [Burkholderia pseudomallei Pasteur 52237]EDP87331.1 hypothe